MITDLRPIAYDPRSDLITPLAEIDPEDLPDEIAAIEAIGYDAEPVRGWAYTHRIRLHPSDDEDEPHADYLATLEEDR